MSDAPSFDRLKSWFGIPFLAIALALTSQPALTQGFMVKPMRMEVAPVPGRSFDVPLEIRNTADGARDVVLRLVELTQVSNGQWSLLDSGQASPTPGLYSSLGWTSLPQSRLIIEPFQSESVAVHLDVPADARGVYFAGIIAETPLPKDSQGIAIRIRFLIPLIIEISGRPVRQHVELGDVEMALTEATTQAPASTVASLVVINNGRTYSRINGTITIERQTEGTWRSVTRIEVPERSILPGFTLAFSGDMQRRLPSGTYRLRGELKVDGRRIAPLIKEIAFEGDPNADALAYDTALTLMPATVTMDVVPGATRTTTLTIENPGIEPVKVSMSSETPPALGGVQMGTLMGIDLSAQPWTEIRPAEFTIRPGRRQHVRVVSHIPADGAHYPNYYADLVLRSVYASGQNAGTTRSTIHLANTQQTSVANAVVEQFGLEEGEAPGQYIVQTRLANIGNVDIAPLAKVYLLSPQGRQLRSVALSGDEQMLLPLGKRSYSAEIAFDGIEPGYYALRAVFGIGGGKDVTRQQVVRLEMQETTDADGKTVTAPVLTVDPDAPEIAADMNETFGPPMITLGGDAAPDAGAD